MESMVNRVVEDYGPDPSKWPKYVVIVDKVQP
jgi:hypothetical protein